MLPLCPVYADTAEDALLDSDMLDVEFSACADNAALLFTLAETEDVLADVDALTVTGDFTKAEIEDIAVAVVELSVTTSLINPLTTLTLLEVLVLKLTISLETTETDAEEFAVDADKLILLDKPTDKLDSTSWVDEAKLTTTVVSVAPKKYSSAICEIPELSLSDAGVIRRLPNEEFADIPYPSISVKLPKIIPEDVVVPWCIKFKAVFAGILENPRVAKSCTVGMFAVARGIVAMRFSRVTPKLPAVPVEAESVTDCTDFTPVSPACRGTGYILFAGIEVICAVDTVLRPAVPDWFVYCTVTLEAVAPVAV